MHFEATCNVSYINFIETEFKLKDKINYTISFTSISLVLKILCVIKNWHNNLSYITNLFVT